MMRVNEVSKLTGVSIRTLQYYDKIGLLHPNGYTEAGYRLYDDTALERLQQINSLTLKKEHLDNLITFARGLQQVGGKNMDFSAFDTTKMNEYKAEAKKQWGHTKAYQEYEEKSKGYSIGENYYSCTPEILKSLGAAYGAGGEFTENIDKVAGKGTAIFVEKAISIFCK